MHISETVRWIFSIRSSMELSLPVVVQRHRHLPIWPIWACPWENGQIWYHWDPNFVERISWNHWMDLHSSKLYRFVETYSWAMWWLFVYLPHMGLPIGPKLVPVGSRFAECIIWNHWTDILHTKLFGIVYTCSCSPVWCMPLGRFETITVSNLRAQ